MYENKLRTIIRIVENMIAGIQSSNPKATSSLNGLLKVEQETKWSPRRGSSTVSRATMLGLKEVSLRAEAMSVKKRLT
jgi:hypothetical protein